MEQQIVGLDVSKAWLDGYWSASGRRLRVSNDAAGIERLIEAAGEAPACLMVMQASGGYERTAHRALPAQGVAAAIVNPKRVRDFARGMGLEAKTDRVDARLIARYGEVMRPTATPAPDPARAELREILGCRRQLIDEITVRLQQLEHLRSPASGLRPIPRREVSGADRRGRGSRRSSPCCARRPRSSPGCCGSRSRPTRPWPPTARS